MFTHTKSHHHTTNKHSVFPTLVHRDTAICDQECPLGETEFLRNTFKHSAYSDKQDLMFSIHLLEKTSREDPASVAFLTFDAPTTNLITMT
jgi:hypothetical protein